MSNYIYKYVNNNEILYIGKTKNLKKRIETHGKEGDNIDNKYWDEINNSDIYFIEVPTNTIADVIESELIRRYEPKCNKSKKTRWCGLEFVEPQWEKYDPTQKREKPYYIRLDITGRKKYISTMAGINGISMTAYIQNLIDEDMKKNKAIRNLIN